MKNKKNMDILFLGTFLVFLVSGVLYLYTHYQDVGCCAEAWTNDWSSSFLTEDGPGGTVIMEHDLVQAEKLEEMAFAFYSVYQSVEVRQDDQVIYERNDKTIKSVGKATPSGWNYVWINPYEGTGKLTVILKSPYKIGAEVVPKLYLGSENGVIEYSYQRSMWYFLIDGMILFLGIFWIVHYIYTKRDNAQYHSRYAVGLFAVIFSCWLFFGQEYQPAMIISDAVKCYMAQLLFLMLPVSYAFILSKLTLSKLVQRAARIVLVLSSVNLIAGIVLQYTGIVDIVDIIQVTYILMVADVLATAGSYAVRYRRDAFKFRSAEFAGIFCLILSTIIEVIGSYWKWNEQAGVISRIGAIIFFVSIALTWMEEDRKKQILLLKRENSLKESKMRMLVSQIQPHFIYNTLASIQALIKIEPEQATYLTYTFSKYLRENIALMDEADRILMSKELEHIRSYVSIEKVRFDERLNVIYEIQTENFYVPTLSIQPLVENAIKHGVCKRDEGGTVRLKSWESSGTGYIIIEDDGVGFDVDKVLMEKTASVGLRNCIWRLKNVLHADVTISSIIGSGTHIEISFQMEEQDSENDSGR